MRHLAELSSILSCVEIEPQSLHCTAGAQKTRVGKPAVSVGMTLLHAAE